MSSSSPVPTLTTQPSIYSPQPVYHPNVRSPSLHSQALSDFKSADKTSSLLVPPLTRDPSSVDSNSTAGYLPTPTDDVMHVPPPLSRDESTITSYYRDQAFPEQTGQHGLLRKNRVVQGSRTSQRPVSVQTNSFPYSLAGSATYPALVMDTHSSSDGRNTTRDSPPVPPKMERQRAARDLISRYEDLDSAAQATPTTPSGSQRPFVQRPGSLSNILQMSRRDLSLPPILPIGPSPTRSQGETSSSPPHAPHSHCLPESPSYFSFARKGGKLRNSFTNLVQLLGDKTRSKDNTKKRNSVSPSVSPSRSFNALSKGFKLRLSKRASVGSSPSSSPEKAKGDGRSNIIPDINELLKLKPMVSTLLLYQSPARQMHPSIPDQKTPLWMPYIVSLYPSSIILQVPSPGLSSSSKFQIPLSELYDAHSVATKDLSPESIPLLGSNSLPAGFGEDLYVFEAQCYGGRIERFAAPTMAMRTTWVRYLLDVLANKDSGLKKEGDALDKVEEHPVSAPSVVPTHRLTGIQHLPSTSSLAFASLPTGFSPDSTLSTADMTTTCALTGLATAPRSIEERATSTLMGLSTPTKSSCRILDSRPSNVCAARQTTSTLPNPWNPTTPLRRPASSVTPSLLMSPRSDRSRMTSSPSICRLDERSLVRNRLAMFEQQYSPNLNGRGPVSRGKEGSINWEALSEIRSGRSGSGISRTTSRGRSPSTKLFLEAASAVSTPISNGTLFRPVWPFPEPTTHGSVGISGKTNLKPVGLTREPGASPFGSATLGSVNGFNTTPRHSRGEACIPPLSLPMNRTTEPGPNPIQVLGNLPPSKNIGINPLQLTSGPVEPSGQGPIHVVLDRLNLLTTALRESDAAHSTKTSGLGQLIASTQDCIVQAMENSTKLASADHVTLVAQVEALQVMLESLVAKPSLGAEERANLVSIKETMERVDGVITARLEILAGNGGGGDEGEIKTLIAERTDGIKQTIQDLALKLDWASTQHDVLAKLDALAETLAGVTSSRDLDAMEEFVQQIKCHISSLAPKLEPLAMDISAIMEKLDTLSNSMETPATPIGFSTIQATLEDIRELSKARPTADLALPLSIPQTDMSDVLMKLDGITAMCQSIMEARAEASGPEASSEGLHADAQQTLLTVLKDDAEHRTAQAQQTAELVRYSNELNVWLEKFVTNASTQMDGVGTEFRALRRDFGLDPSPTEGQGDSSPPPQGVIQELRGMFEEQIKSASDIATSLNALLAAFNEEQARGVQARENLATDSVVKMIEVQRQEQERLLKQLASDLSSDIRGERIRFVEAMSQATSMNVQLHVEEFKKQLTHEVLALTDEVGRLREERKTIQHQIAQLFLVKSEHETECRSSDAPQPPPRPLSNTRPNGK